MPTEAANISLCSPWPQNALLGERSRSPLHSLASWAQRDLLRGGSPLHSPQ